MHYCIGHQVDSITQTMILAKMLSCFFVIINGNTLIEHRLFVTYLFWPSEKEKLSRFRRSWLVSHLSQSRALHLTLHVWGSTNNLLHANYNLFVTVSTLEGSIQLSDPELIHKQRKEKNGKTAEDEEAPTTPTNCFEFYK